MKRIKYPQSLKGGILMIILLICFAGAKTFAASITFKNTLSGNQLSKDSLVTVTDTVFFSSSLASKLNKPYPVQDLVTFRIDEATSVYLPASFTASIRVRITYTKADLTTDYLDTTLTINYDSAQANTYTTRYSLSFAGAYSVTVKVLSNVNITPSLSIASALLLENQVTSQPDYIFTCTSNVVKSITMASFAADSTGDEEKASWPNILGADEYDVEWAYMDSSTLAGGVDTAHPNGIFAHNATRVTVSKNSYLIPLMYDNKGRLFVRVRAVKDLPGGARMETNWSTNYLPNGLGKLYYNGHADSLNWQSTITFAEDGKRKVVVQYYDGSLRSRQTVTKDNTTSTTVVAETFYDYQGRPVVQVMPAPTIDKIIHFTANFNREIGGSEYDKDNYDYFSTGGYCTAGASPMDTSSGAAKYYSPANPNLTGINRYIPDAEGFAFTETEYTQDNTGRINRQSGVGPTFKLSNGHETKYYYSTPDQDELDALFGTEVGDNSHYFKTAVQDANGQFSVSYVDMHGRTIATALAGPIPKSLDKVPNNDTANIPTITETIANAATNITTNLVMQSQKNLLVTKQDDYVFKYDLDPDSLRKKDCSNTTVCYGCLYNLEIIISDNCNNESLKFNASKLFDTVIKRFSMDSMSYYAASCNKPQGFHFQFTKSLYPGTYQVTKKLSVNKQAASYYRDSVFMAKNTCISQDSMIKLQMSLQLHSNCTGTPLSDTSTGDYEDIRTAMLLDMTAPSGQYANPDSSTIDPFSIFYVALDSNVAAEYQRPPTPYLDEAGNTDHVFDDSTGVYVLPGQLDKAQFVNKFKASWASSLLPYHKEYCKLQQYQIYQNSFIWDRKFEKADTYAEAVSKGFLNPTASSSAPFTSYAAPNATYKDPLATISSGAYKTKLESKIQADTASTIGGTNYPVSLWVMATLAVQCDNDVACESNLIQTNTAFASALSYTGDLDMAWRNFREMYLGIKQHIIDSLIIVSGCADKTDSILMLHHTLNFNNAYSALAQNGLGYLSTLTTGGSTTSQNNIKTAIAQQNDSTCWHYAKVWAQQLASCNYPVDSVNNIIIPRLVKVCEKGSDIEHPFGSRDISPDSTNTFTSFDAVIDNYNTKHGITKTWACNADLITAPKPYNNQVVYANKPSWAPDSCECGHINTLFNEFVANQIPADNSSFSAYLLRRYQTAIPDSDLTALMNQCNPAQSLIYVPPATYMAKAINLPPVFQCYSGDICIGCQQMNALYSQYIKAYPQAAPGLNTDDSLQLAKNTFFTNYMNNHLGFAKTAGDYLDFMQECNLNFIDSSNGGGTSPYTCAGLKANIANYKAVSGYIPKLDSSGHGLDTSHWKVDFGGWNYTAGVSLKSIFKNGVAQLPASYISTLMADPHGQREVAFDYYNDTLCLPSSFTFETRLKLPDSQIDTSSDNWSHSSWWIWLYTNDSAGTGQSGVLASFHPDSPGVAVCTNMFVNQQCANDNVPGVHMNNWTDLKFQFDGTQFTLLVNDTIRSTRTLNFPVNKLYTWSLSQQSLYGAVDFVKIYDTNGDTLYNEGFYDSTIIAYPSLQAKCLDDCSSRFTRYFDHVRDSNYTAAQISNFYLEACDTALSICVDNSLTLCGKSTPVFGPVTDHLNNCSDSTFFGVSAGMELYKWYHDSLQNNFDSLYNAKCLQAYKYESFTVTHKENEYHFTLYYYDQAGNLVKTVPPQGVKYNFRQTWFDSVAGARVADTLLAPAHTLITQYRYNSLNKMITKLTPDDSLSNYYYDRIGRLVVSQNSKQRAASPDMFSYTTFDALGRTIEAGELTSSIVINTVTSRMPVQLANWLSAAWTTRTQIIKTYYDTPYVISLAPYTTQRNLRNRISWTAIYDSAVNANAIVKFSAATFFTYDAHGSVDTLLQDYGHSSYKANVMNTNNNRFKRTVYQYGLISGKVSSVAYQPNKVDAFYHVYSYDAENRLTSVQTSTDSIYWETEAAYTYYKHGSLARTVLGQAQVQGVDYAYTLQGWLKGINSTAISKTIDMGGDGASFSTRARDVFGLCLYYYDTLGPKSSNDYTPIYTKIPFATLPTTGANAVNFKPQYNGNIAAISVNLPIVGNPMLYNYTYDQLNRTTAMQAYTGLNNGTNIWTPAAITDYKENVNYDANGNILTYNRYANSGQLMDSLKYNYVSNSNKLDYVNDRVSTPAIPGDIENGEISGNYRYDGIGNVVKDSAGGVDTIYWNVYGKIRQVVKKDTTINYTYDAVGNRISKTVIKPSFTTSTWYVRDATGNVMSVYTAGNSSLNGGQLTQAETYLYGSSRLGMTKPNINVQTIATPIKIPITGLDTGYILTFIRGNKFFELTNHLGNVLATIADRKIGINISGTVNYYTAVVINAQDYYPGGSLEPGRQFSSGTQYRYGFNGKEKSDEIEGNGVGYDYGARIYDARIDRWFSTDPLQQKYPNESPYVFAGNNPIYMVDDGGQTKTTFYTTIDDRTGKTTVRQEHTNQLFKQRIEVGNSFLGIDTHDYHYEYQWYDITSLVVTHIDKNGKATTTTTTNNKANLKTTTDHDWGQKYANSGFWSAVGNVMTKIFTKTKESSVQDGYVEMSREGGRDNGYNKSSLHISGIIDIDLLLAAVNSAKTQSELEPLEDVGNSMKQLGNLAESLKKLAKAGELASDISKNIYPEDKEKEVVAHCPTCERNFRDSSNQWVETNKPATDTMDNVIEYQPVDKTPLKKKKN